MKNFRLSKKHSQHSSDAFRFNPRTIYYAGSGQSSWIEIETRKVLNSEEARLMYLAELKTHLEKSKEAMNNMIPLSYVDVFGKFV